MKRKRPVITPLIDEAEFQMKLANILWLKNKALGKESQS